MLTGKQKRYLRSLAHHLDPIFQVGKGGVNENMTKSITEAMTVRELIKISLLTNFEGDTKEAAAELAEGAGAEIVQVIGKTVVLYKEAKDVKYKKIELPR